MYSVSVLKVVVKRPVVVFLLLWNYMGLANFILGWRVHWTDLCNLNSTSYCNCYGWACYWAHELFIVVLYKKRLLDKVRQCDLFPTEPFKHNDSTNDLSNDIIMLWSITRRILITVRFFVMFVFIYLGISTGSIYYRFTLSHGLM